MKMEIRSAKQALKESLALKSVWSSESVLTQRILIYIAELLENKQRTVKPKRKLTKWQLHVQKALKAGKSIRQASAEWQGREDRHS